MNITQYLEQVPDYQQFFTTQEMASRTRLLEVAYPATLRRVALGHSRLGAPIEMVSIGNGASSVMVVGAPHPHELVGTLMADHLLQLFCQQPDLLQSTGATWHFIQAIDPDGVNLNAGWLNQPLSADRYFSSFFRPPLSRQAEFTFPFSSGSHVFSAGTPENRAWKKALDLTQPDLLYSTHNCDIGGVFYFTSEGLPELDQALSALTLQHQFDVDVDGEAGSMPKAGIPGVFSFPDEIAASIQEISSQDTEGRLTTGDSSAGYAQKKFDTFSLIAEVPYWRLSHNTARLNIEHIASQTRVLAQQSEYMIKRYGPMISCVHETGARLLLEALTLHTANNELIYHGAASDIPFTTASAVTGWFLALRRPAMLLNLLEMSCRTDSATQVHAAYKVVKQQMVEWVTALELAVKPERVPLRKLVQLQTAAGLLALHHLQARRMDKT